MDNTIYLYKIDYAFNSYRQPYFMNEDSRDRYFEDKEFIQVNATGVNINIGKDYKIDFKGNLDITVASTYNFAVIKYNGKKYYANIIDSYHISVNMSWFNCERNPFFEIINPFYTFSNFLFKKISFNSLSFSQNGKLNPIRNYKLNSSLFLLKNFFKISIPFESMFLDNSWEFERYLVLTFSLTGQIGDFNNLMAPYQGDVAIIPLFSFERAYYANTDGTVVEKLNPFTGEFSKYIATIKYYMNECAGKLQKAQIINIPTPISETNVLLPYPINGYEEYNNELTGKIDIFLLNNKEFERGSISLTWDNFDSVLYGNLPPQLAKLDFLFFNNDNEISVDLYKYWSESLNKVNFRISISNFVDTEEFYYIIKIEAPSSDSLNFANPIVKTIKCPSSIPFTIDQENLFRAENSYYAQLTNSYSQQTIEKGTLQAGSELLAGIAQWKMGASVLGSGNMIRGGVNLAQTMVDNYYLLEQRDLAAKQEMSKPSSYSPSHSPIDFYQPFNFQILLRVSNINTSDYESLKQEMLYYGLDVSFGSDDFNIKDYAIDNKIALSFMAIYNGKIPLQRIIYEKLYYYFTETHLYEIKE